eukprot:CAMPEP_0201720658 /NCGR_PEP_ID=MMETSP0593-20130828/5536_1 /ASSEMBLY_ACC=CAM_ASM_000672 /TAXON_ID=267983 /ORGANISM="Skeletonema japonicum, Strain CCMP2506" /LENGTH=52 /DNA_ID=CAMNT_0048211329 /DNA_START=61 /DNA_END=215 /DNA_ORIENTATION=-
MDGGAESLLFVVLLALLVSVEPPDKNPNADPPDGIDDCCSPSTEEEGCSGGA